MMKKTFLCALLPVVIGFYSGTATANPQSGAAATKKAFDFVVGVNGDFKAAMTAASSAASSGNRFYIFFPNGEYAIGALTGDANQKTTVSTSNLSFIGENIDSTIISNKATSESISTTATLYFNNANNLYLQDLTVLNKGNYYDPAASSSTGRYVAIQDQGDKNVYKKVKLLSKQDTYYSLSSRTYWEECEIHGYVDFICGYGDVFFNKCLLYLEQRSTVVIAAPSTKTSWGYVFMDCIVDGLAGDGYRLGRPWSNQPKCVYINTTMKKLASSDGWGDPMNVVPALFAEYNSKTASGSAVNLSGRRTTYTKDATTVTLNPVLTADQAAQYTIKNVVGGSDNWQPDNLTKQLSAPVVRQEGATLNWNDDANALCWVVFKDGKYYKCVTSNSCDIASDTQAKYSVRAANAMGGLGPVSDTGATAVIFAAAAKMNDAAPSLFFNSVRRTIGIRIPAARNLTAAVYSLSGRNILSKDFSASPGTGEVNVPIGGIGKGTYLVRTEFDGSVKTERIYVW
jgi:pectin methylesterase-like acyl-CoA thioesterase